jgi:ubiquinone/menaquinone biosynthesis C-methylase UbiE
MQERIIVRWRRRYPAEIVGKTNLSTREAWLEKTLKKIPSGKRVLDAGAGELQYKRFCSHLDYVSQDLGQYEGKGDAHGLQMGGWDNSKLDIVSDITAIPVKDTSFDAVMCIEVFEHLPRPIEALREFYRILQPDGTLIITAPISSLTHFAPFYFYNGFSRYFFEHLLAEEGFELTELTYNGNYFDYVAQEIRRIEETARLYIKNIPKFELVDELAAQKVLNRLEALSKLGGKSSELLSFGLQVVARRARRRQNP